MKKTEFRSTCAIAVSIDLFGDKWSLLILRDMLLHRKSTFKEFSESKEKIASNILTNRLEYLTESGFIIKFNPKGTKKSATYIATRKGICVLPLLVELYLFSIESLSESILNESQKGIKAEIFDDRELFITSRRERYLEFIHQFQSNFEESQTKLMQSQE